MLSQIVYLRKTQKENPEADPGTLPPLTWNSLCFVTLVNDWKPLIIVAKCSFGPSVTVFS